MITQRLIDVINKVRPEVAIPIIIEVTAAPQQAEQSLRSMGMQIKYVSKVLPLIYGSANSTLIQQIAGQGFVKEVSYDEPIFAL